MKMAILTGKSRFWQWDAGQKLLVEDTSCGFVHFCNGTTKEALVSKIYEQDGVRVADVPNILLQTANLITAYLYQVSGDGQETRLAQRFEVVPRNKPADYVYEETEVFNYEVLEAKIDALKSGGTFIPSVSGAGELSWTNDVGLPNPEPVNIIGPQGSPGPKGDPGEKGDPGDTLLPKVTEAANGSILQVVDGTWAAVTLEETGLPIYIGALIEQYIEEALGGDY